MPGQGHGGPGPWRLRFVARMVRAGGVVAYPTEAVYGLGCDPLVPEAVERLLALKGRSGAKGLILIAAEYAQLVPYVDLPAAPRAAEIAATWPGFATWVLPARAGVPVWLTGGRRTLAVRVTAHPLCARLCAAFGGPLVSTSANPSGRRPARDPLTVRRYFGRELDYVLHGPLGGERRPSTIRDGRTGAVLRP